MTASPSVDRAIVSTDSASPHAVSLRTSPGTRTVGALTFADHTDAVADEADDQLVRDFAAQLAGSPAQLAVLTSGGNTPDQADDAVSADNAADGDQTAEDDPAELIAAVSPAMRASAERDARTPELFQKRDDAADEAGWHAAVNELVELHLPLARSIANRYRTQHGDHADLVQVACLGLVKAVLRFRPAVGAPFVSFAVPTITGEVRRYFRDHAWDVRPPRHLQELRPDVDRAGQELAQLLGRSPTAAEIAGHLEVPVREVLATQRAVSTGLNMHSLEALTDASPSLSLRDTIGGLDRQLEMVTDRLALRPLIAALPERDRRILVLRYVEEFTQRQIATELGLSQTQVCRLLTRILGELRERLEDPRLFA